MPRRTSQTDATSAIVPRVSGVLKKRPYLMMLTGPQFGQMTMLEPGRELVIGRKEDAVDIYVRDDGVSRRHASILVGTEGARLCDLDSANGTFVDGVRVSDCLLEDGCRIHIGIHSMFKFAYSDEIEATCQRKLAEGALHEPLTGLYNRRHFMERLSAELAAAQRHGRPLSLLMVDIDHFKAVNDQHGHLAGDEALKRLAQVMQEATRKEDVLARYGGEEFVVLARETGQGGGRALAERIREAVERSNILWSGKQLTITVSIGVSTLEGGESDEQAHQRLLETADRALYQAKESGRNRVVAVSITPTTK